MTQILANGIHLEYQTHGDASHPALFLIRGLGTQMSRWPNTLINGLVDQEFYVIAFDNRDTGLSQKN